MPPSIKVLRGFIKQLPTTTRAWIYIIILSVTWGSSFILLKYALIAFTPGQVAASRMFFAALTLLPYALYQVSRIPREKWGALIIFAIVTNIFTTFFYAMAQSELDSALNGILNTLTPLMTLMIGLAVYKQKINWMQSAGLAIGLVGTIFLLKASGGGEIQNVNIYVVFIVGATILNGITANMLKFNLTGMSALQIASVAFLIVLPLAAGYVWYSGFFSTALADSNGLRGLGFIILLAVFANAMALLLISRIIQLTNPVFGTLTTYLVPVVAVLWGIWDGEIVNIWQICCMLLIFVSVYVVQRASKSS